MSIEKLADLYEVQAKANLKVIYGKILGDAMTIEQIEKMVDYVMGLGIKNEYLKAVNLLFSEKEVMEFYALQNKYQDRLEDLNKMVSYNVDTLIANVPEGELMRACGWED
tara:strand:+ start:2427 stop:2756 length:330 start_codon:yes stop_codon:yes gene_type:complete